MVSKRAERERGNDVFLCFIDYSKAFDAVAHDIFWVDMHKMGVPNSYNPTNTTLVRPTKSSGKNKL